MALGRRENERQQDFWVATTDLQGRRGIGDRRVPPPDRKRPGRVGFVAHDMVQVQLRHLVAERRDIQLVAAERLHQERGKVTGLAQQLQAVVVGELVDFPYIFAVRHENEPGVIAIVHQQQTTQRIAPQRMAIGAQLRV